MLVSKLITQAHNWVAEKNSIGWNSIGKVYDSFDVKQVQESDQARNDNWEGKKHEARRDSDSVSGYIANVNLDGLSAEQKDSSKDVSRGVRIISKGRRNR